MTYFFRAKLAACGFCDPVSESVSCRELPECVPAAPVAREPRPAGWSRSERVRGPSLYAPRVRTAGRKLEAQYFTFASPQSEAHGRNGTLLRDGALPGDERSDSGRAWPAAAAGAARCPSGRSCRRLCSGARRTLRCYGQMLCPRLLLFFLVATRRTQVECHVSSFHARVPLQARAVLHRREEVIRSHARKTRKRSRRWTRASSLQERFSRGSDQRTEMDLLRNDNCMLGCGGGIVVYGVICSLDKRV